eukprot:2044076-Rhodomonas_salina.1
MPAGRPGVCMHVKTRAMRVKATAVMVKARTVDFKDNAHNIAIPAGSTFQHGTALNTEDRQRSQQVDSHAAAEVVGNLVTTATCDQRAATSGQIEVSSPCQ